ncbi:hypothetical protein KXW98_003955 [Aspergillus fumigatus]|uniref:Uncharacterized protein n=1 Tax=Aspergillus fumigatus TaxID=746128 RepID=A0A229W5H7_ASPFM|nr:hypothetical protein KXX45_006220 [Aspergillus fumigatus]KAH1288962.1 hypothetical protein KXX48_008584 [Aspergillus fumigatus]KAH1295612.1 hypothetical protein KXX30_001312 [Aspergillus fumigatus]KAH1299870.1 hypothetical protein KXX11_006012 [Aspergillus fumigatus]KAH1312006.1 hypothetical protein KXX47_005190 [Aspergillus fumigatus]
MGTRRLEGMRYGVVAERPGDQAVPLNRICAKGLAMTQVHWMDVSLGGAQSRFKA